MRSVAVFVVTLLLTLLTTGCKEEKNLVPSDKFSDIYIELLQIQDSLGTADILVRPALDTLLKKHGVPKPLYDSTVQYYMRNPAEFREFMVTVREKVAALKPERSSMQTFP